MLSAQTPVADVTVVAEPTTNAAANNGKITITIDPSGATTPYTISLTGPGTYTYNATTSNSATTITGLVNGNYTGKVVDNGGCSAAIDAKVQKCKIMPTVPSGTASVICELISAPGPGGDAKKFYSTGVVNAFVNATPSDFTFQTFHSLPDYLFDQIRSTVNYTMKSEITSLIQTDYSAYEVQEQNEFQSNAPFIFAFNADGSIIWVYRNLSADLSDAANRSIGGTAPKSRSVFPNPTSGLVYIPVGDKYTDRRIAYKVINTMAQTVLANTQVVEKEADNFSLDLSALPAGFYFVNISDQHGNSDTFSVSKM